MAVKTKKLESAKKNLCMSEPKKKTEVSSRDEILSDLLSFFLGRINKKEKKTDRGIDKMAEAKNALTASEVSWNVLTFWVE